MSDDPQAEGLAIRFRRGERLDPVEMAILATSGLLTMAGDLTDTGKDAVIAGLEREARERRRLVGNLLTHAGNMVRHVRGHADDRRHYAASAAEARKAFDLLNR